MGGVNPRSQKMRWFGGLYLASVAALALITVALRALLWVVGSHP
jgi:hypothetical protein